MFGKNVNGGTNLKAGSRSSSRPSIARPDVFGLNQYNDIDGINMGGIKEEQEQQEQQEQHEQQKQQEEEEDRTSRRIKPTNTS